MSEDEELAEAHRLYERLIDVINESKSSRPAAVMAAVCNTIISCAKTADISPLDLIERFSQQVLSKCGAELAGMEVVEGSPDGKGAT